MGKEEAEDVYHFANDEASVRARAEREWVAHEGLYLEERLIQLHQPSLVYLHLTVDDQVMTSPSGQFIPSAARLKHLFEVYLLHLHRQTGERVYYSASLELGPQSDRPHAHAVLAGGVGLTPDLAATVWRYGLVEAEPYVCGGGGSQYLMKHLPADRVELIDNLTPTKKRARRRRSRKR